MANEAPGLSISRGTGLGSAQVFDLSPLLNTIAQKQAEAKKKREALDSQLQESLSDIELEGIRTPDSEAVIDQYNKLVDLYGDITRTESASDRIRKESEFNKSKAKLMGLVNRSLETKKLEKQLWQIGAQTPVDQLSDNFMKSFNELKSVPVTSDKLNQLTDFSLYQRKAKPIDLNSAIDEIATKSRQAFETGFKSVGGGQIAREEGERLNYNLFKQNLLQKGVQDSNFLNQLEDSYEPIFQGRTEKDMLMEMAEARKLGIDDYDPTDKLDFIALQNYTTRKGTTEFEPVKSIVRTAPRPRGGGESVSSFVQLDNEGRPVASRFNVGGTTSVSAMDVAMPTVRSLISIDPDIKAKNPEQAQAIKDLQGKEAEFTYASMRLVPFYKKGADTQVQDFPGAEPRKISVSGEPVEENELEQAIEQGLVEWKPIIPGIVEDEFGTKIDVYIPADRKIQEVVLKASKDDAAVLKRRYEVLKQQQEAQNRAGVGTRQEPTQKEQTSERTQFTGVPEGGF